MALHHARQGEVVHLGPLGASDSQSTAIIKTERFEAIRLVVPAGTEARPHDVPGIMTLQCIEGRVEIGLADATIELGPGDWVYLGGGPCQPVRGIEHALLLLTIIFNR